MAWTTSRIDRPTAKPAPPLSLITSAPLPRVRVRIASATVEFQPGNCSSGNPAAWAVDQIGTMLSPCSPRISAVTCVGGSSSSSAIRLRNRAVSSCVPRPITWRRRQVELANGQIGQHVHRVGDDQHDRVALDARPRRPGRGCPGTARRCD